MPNLFRLKFLIRSTKRCFVGRIFRFCCKKSVVIIYLCNKIMNIQKIYSLKCCIGKNKSVNLRLLKKLN